MPLDLTEREQQAALAIQRAAGVSMAVNLLVSCTQVLCGVAFHSKALIADGLHSLSDVLADVVVLVASRHARRHADADHPYATSASRRRPRWCWA
jgi:divalent metal cation (Fe/Co/Zn/Cd) transporter